MTFSETMILPGEARLSTLSREITALTERLAGVSEAAVLRSLDAMQTAGMTMPPAIEPKKILAVYHYALCGVPGSGLAAATQKLIRGDYAANPNVLLGTIPKPPVLSALAKAEALTLRAELARKREIVAALTADRTDKRRSAASRSRVQALLENFRRAHAAARREASQLGADTDTETGICAAELNPSFSKETFHAA
ncbi:MAG TPA: hypothetical protein VGO04_03665 [Ensifer sp.]|jgi:hypothetical protein|uniref:hypothetical protein n=1 Tax=Ensifer sp. TaxID=1872086 RepID=UPI002E131BBF|nr:hypothetical protein [Ensifer sp.]